MRQAERYVHEGLHPRILVEGLELARDETMKFLDESKIPTKSFVGSTKSEEKENDLVAKNSDLDRDLLRSVAHSSLRTKLDSEMASHLADIVVDAVLTVRNTDHPNPDSQVDLHMVEIMIMTHKSEFDTKLVRGLVLDHGARHPMMAKVSDYKSL